FYQAEDGIRYRNVTGVQTCSSDLGQLEGEHRTRSRGLGGVEAGLLLAVRAGEVDPGDVLAPAQVRHDRLGVGLLALEPQREGLDRLDQAEGVLRGEHPALRLLR